VLVPVRETDLGFFKKGGRPSTVKRNKNKAQFVQRTNTEALGASAQKEALLAAEKGRS